MTVSSINQQTTSQAASTNTIPNSTPINTNAQFTSTQTSVPIPTVVSSTNRGDVSTTSVIASTSSSQQSQQSANALSTAQQTSNSGKVTGTSISKSNFTV
jgi:hypothetical protein